MADDLQFDPYRFIASQNKLNFAKDELESFMAKVTEAELFIMPKDMPCKILLNKHLKTLEKYPANLNDWDIKMTDFKNMISTLDATFAEQLGVDNSEGNVSDELADIESELVTLNEKYDEYMSKVTQYASRREAYPATEEDKAMLSRKKELEARQAEINGTLHIEEDKWYEDIANAGKTLFKSAEDVVDSVLKGDKDSIIENSIDLGTQLKATEAVVDTSVVSGVGKIVEGILDGVGFILTGVASIPTGILDGGMYLLSKAANIEFESTTKKMWEQTMDDVARDKVGEINDSFYTDTLLGQTINDNSALKYDGAGAEAVQTGAKFVGEVALFTVSGGTLAPVLGGLESLGESAQNEYQKEDRRIFTPRMAVETAGGVFKGIMYNRIGTNILKLGQLGVKQGIATVVDNAKASISKVGFKGLFKHAFWSKDALQDAAYTVGQKAAEGWIQQDETGTVDWGSLALSTVTEFLTGRFSDTALGLARGDDWTKGKSNLDMNSEASPLIVSTDVKLEYAYKNYIQGEDIFNIPDSSKITTISDLRKFPGESDIDKLDFIKNLYGEYSPMAITATSVLQDTYISLNPNTFDNKINYGNTIMSNGVLNAEQLAVVNRVVDVISAGDKTPYRVFSNEQSVGKYFKDDLNYLSNVQNSVPSKYEQDIKTPIDSTKRIEIITNSTVSDEIKGLAGVKTYTSFDYNSMAKSMRENVIDPIFSGPIEALSKFLDPHSLKEPVLLFRGTDDLQFLLDKYGVDPSLIKSGDAIESKLYNLSLLTGGDKILTDNSFISTTPLYGEGFTNKEIVEVIKAQSGTKGLYVGNFSTMPGEYEFLIQCGEGNRRVIESIERIGRQIFLFTNIISNGG